MSAPHPSDVGSQGAAGSPADPGSATGASGQPASPWTSLPEDIRENPAITRHKDVSSLAKEYVNLQSVVGRKGVVLPKEGDEQDAARFWKELGWPEKPDEYGVNEIPVPEGLPWDADFAQLMLSEMHKAHLTKEQARAVFQSYLQHDADRWSKHLVAQEQAAGQTAQMLRKEWGIAYNQNISLAGKTFASVFGSDFPDIDQVVLADGRRLGDDPRFLKAMLVIGRKLGEDSLLVSSGTGSERIMSPDEAKAEYDKLMADADFRKDLYDKHSPGHAAAVQRQDALFRQQFPPKPEGA